MSEVTITAQPDGTFTDPTGKKFLPEEKVNTVVQDRLARDREARKDENATKAEEALQKLEEAKSALETANQQLTTLQGTSATAEEIKTKVQASLEKIKSGLPPEKQKLVPSKLSPAEQIEYIADNHELFFPTVTPPNTPPPVNNQGGDGGEAKFGGYASLTEWAQKDIQGYTKAKREGKLPKF